MSLNVSSDIYFTCESQSESFYKKLGVFSDIEKSFMNVLNQYTVKTHISCLMKCLLVLTSHSK